jgi:hypothetical protein
MVIMAIFDVSIGNKIPFGGGWGQKETLKSTKFTIILNCRNPN